MKNLDDKTRKVLTNLARQLDTQDSLATADPLFCVQQKRRIYGVDPAYHSCDYAWHSDDEVYDSDIELEDSLVEYHEMSRKDAKKRIEKREPIHLTITTFKLTPYLETWEFVSAHFTQQAADFFIKQNKHNLTKPRVYVSSQFRCWEWQTVVKVLKEYEFGEDV